MANHFDKQFNLDTVQYYKEQAELGRKGCAKNLGGSQQPISRWKKELGETGDRACRGSGNYASDTEKEHPRSSGALG